MELRIIGHGIGNLMGALKVERHGAQNQRFDYDGFADQFREQFVLAVVGGPRPAGDRTRPGPPLIRN